MTLHPGIPLRREKGKPEGYAVTGNTRKPWVAEKGLVLYDAAGQNNSNLTLLTALVVNGEWELILVMSSHYCFYTLSVQPRNTIFIASRGFLPPPRIGCFSLFLPPQPPIWGAKNYRSRVSEKAKVPHLGDLRGKIMTY